MYLSRKFLLREVDRVKIQPPKVIKKIFQYSWKPRWGNHRKYVGNPAMKIMSKYQKYTKKNGKQIQYRIEQRDLSLGSIKAPLDFQFFRVFDELPHELTLCALSYLWSGQIKNVLDVGVNVGTFAMQISQYGDNTRIVGIDAQNQCVETSTSIFKLLNKEFIGVNLALGNHAGFVHLENKVPTFSGYASITSDLVSPDSSSKVPIARLDDYFDKFHFDNLDLIKVDIEGSEYEFFLGSRKTISRFNPVIYYEDLGLEINGIDTTDSILEFLSDLNYSIFIPMWFTVENDEPQISAYIPKDTSQDAEQRIALVPVVKGSEVSERLGLRTLNLIAIPNSKREFFLNILSQEFN